MPEITVVRVDDIILKSEVPDCWEYLLKVGEVTAAEMPPLEQIEFDLAVYGMAVWKVDA